MLGAERKYSLKGPSNKGPIEDLLDGLDDKESRQRLQALIAEWLRMENLVVLTGSGCSIDCGGKTTAGLEKAVLGAVKEIPEANLPKSAKAIIVERLKAVESGGSLSGFEEWLSYLVNAVCLGTAERSPIKSLIWKSGTFKIEEVESLVSFIARAIYAECALELPDATQSPEGEGGIAPHLSFLSKVLARDSNLGRTHLFTLNYDTLFEQALELLGIQYFDGFSGRANARFDPSVYGLDIYYPGEIAEGRVRRFDKFMHFYKLHGSVHWRMVDGQLRARHGVLSKYKGYRSKTPKDKGLALIEKKFARDHNQFGILPTSNKFVQTIEMPYAHIFRAFNARLSVPQTFLLVLGYGFSDEHVTKIIETALMNPSLIMLIVEPNPESWAVKRLEEYKELGKRVFVLTPTKESFQDEEFKYATFNDFAKNVMPDVQWLDDYLRLRRFEKQLQNSHEREDGADAKGTAKEIR